MIEELQQYSLITFWGIAKIHLTINSSNFNMQCYAFLSLKIKTMRKGDNSISKANR